MFWLDGGVDLLNMFMLRCALVGWGGNIFDIFKLKMGLCEIMNTKLEPM